MKEDLERLFISEKEVKKISGISMKTMRELTNDFGEFITRHLIKRGVYFTLAWWIIGLIFIKGGAFSPLGAGLYVILLAVILGVTYRNRKKERESSLAVILAGIKKFDYLIKKIDVADQLADAGNETTLSNRAKLIQGYTNMREDLIRALRTERIFRENKELVTEGVDFSETFTTLDTFGLDNKAAEFSKDVDEAFSIMVDVQEEMKKLNRKLNE
jgi:type II secretory pathway component PulF